MDGNINVVFDGLLLCYGFFFDDVMFLCMENFQVVNLVLVVGVFKDIQDIMMLEFRIIFDDLSVVD